MPKRATVFNTIKDAIVNLLLFAVFLLRDCEIIFPFFFVNSLENTNFAAAKRKIA